MTIAELIADCGVTMTCEPAKSNPHMVGEWEADHWLCTLSRDGHTMPVPFSQGVGHRRWRTKGRPTMENCGLIGQVAPPCVRNKYSPVKGYREQETIEAREYRARCVEPTPPTVESVLDCLASDASGYDNARDFDDWCGEFGFDTDSRKAEACYRTCAEQAKALRHFLGDIAYEALLFQCERL